MAVKNKILLICDEEKTTGYLKEMLLKDQGCSVTLETTAKEGLGVLRKDSFDIIVIKSGLEDMGSIELIRELKRIDPDCIIMVFVKDTESQEVKDLSRLDVYDFISRPVNLQKLSFLVEKGTQLRQLMKTRSRLSHGLKEQNTALERQNTFLAKRIEESTKNLTRLYEDLRSTYMRTIKVLAQAIDARDHYTHSHSENVAKIAVAIASEMSLSAKEIEFIREACELHDLGKIGIEDSILTKPSSLNAQEWEQIKRHPLIGAQILEPLTFLNEVIELVRQHHEHYDGSGYPEGRRGEHILLGARIIHLADAYEAMRSARAYRKVPLSKEEAILEIKKNSGTQFDPKVVEVFLRVVDRF